jgi:hypothetical protein
MLTFSVRVSACVPMKQFDGRKIMTPEERVWNRLWNALDDPFGRRRVYVYRPRSRRRGCNHYIWKGYAWPELPEMLRDDFDGGDFRILIREGSRMVFSGNISVVTPETAHARR